MGVDRFGDRPPVSDRHGHAPPEVLRFGGRLHVIVLFADLIARLLEAVEAWAADAESEVRTWRRTHNLAATPGTRRRLEDIIERADALLGEGAGRS